MKKTNAEVIKLHAVDPRIGLLGERIVEMIYEHNAAHGPLSVVSILGLLETIKIVFVNEEYQI